jgi:hypothetical protein
MGKKSTLALLLFCLVPGLASSLEIKNVRLTHGPLGATRTENKFLPGDYLFMTFELEGLTFDPKTGKASYVTLLELYDMKNQKIFSKETPNEVSAMLGGTRLPGDLHVIMGRDQSPGTYVVRLIVRDKLNKELKYFDHRFELLPANFGLVGVTAPAIGFPGQHYVASFALVDMGLDSQKKPNVKVTMQVMDESGTKSFASPIYTQLPKDLPDEIKLDKENFVPMQFPIYLNRPGRFTIEVTAEDKATNKQAKLRYTLNVLDIASVTGK